jgi:hypothetical protein
MFVFKVDADFELEAELELELEALAVLEAEPDLKDGGRVNFRVDCNYPSAPSRIIREPTELRLDIFFPPPPIELVVEVDLLGTDFELGPELELEVDLP